MAGSIFVASSLLPLSGAGAGELKYEMPKGTPFDSDPAADHSVTRTFMVYGKDKAGREIPPKTVRITNNSKKTIYPIIRDPNSATATEGGKVGLYDPFDDVGREYRGYIGYKEGEKFYFGLKAGESILVRIPLVFWNGARIGLGTDGQFLVVGTKPDGKDIDQNPLRYRNASKRAIAPAEIDTNPRTKADTIRNGVVMWYRAEVEEAPNDDTEDQLAEWTIRDHTYLKTLGKEIPDSELVTLINYDVSNVDNLYLPVAMQVLDAWVVPQQTIGTNREKWIPGSMPESNGWTGSTDPIETLQDEIRKFTAKSNTYLGEYFGKEKPGWPYYNMPNVENDRNMPMKIPSGANIFAQSPLKNVQSSYKDGINFERDLYMLSSGGTEAISVAIGAEGGEKAGATKFKLSQSEAAKKLTFVKPGLLVTTDGGGVFADGTTVKAVNGREVTLSKALIGPTLGSVPKFARPNSDYAAESMIRLWFSWAEYYRKNWKSKNQQAPTADAQIRGTIAQGSATLEFSKEHPELVEGMAVRGKGLDDAMTEKGVHTGDAVILQIAGDKRSVILSQVAREAGNNEAYTFSPPRELRWTPKAGQPGYPLFTGKLNFPEHEREPSRDPYLFAQKVYLIMASMNQIGEPNNDSVCKYMQDVVGANMGFIFDAPGKASDDGKMVTSMIRDMIKSVLRGVTDFTEYPDAVDASNKHLVWYPDPSKRAGGMPFNVFNLDPFVWFVHVKLGFSGYGFSVDDDTADIGAGGANHLQISVAGPKGLDNPHEWTIQAPFGPLTDVPCRYSGPDDKVWAPGTIANVSPTQDKNVLITTQGACNMRDGDLVTIDQVGGTIRINDTFKVRHAKKESFEIVDQKTDKPIPFTGTYTAKTGRFGAPKQPYIDTGSDLARVFHRVTDDDALRTFQGTLVTVNGVSQNGKGVKFRVQRKGDSKEGHLILNTPLTNADGSPLIGGTYKFDFSGTASKEKKP